METLDAAEVIRELREDRAEQDAGERFRSVVALVIAVLATLLAVASLGGGNVSEEVVNSNIHASDTWAFYQAKNIRQTSMNLAADEMEATLLASGASLSPEARRDIEAKVARYRATSARYDDEPDPDAPGDSLRGEGKKQLRARALSHEARRDRAQEQDANFDYASVLYQIAIVLGSVAILALSRPVLVVSLALGGMATLLMVNGFFLAFPLPL
ncbi:MAG TPA: DUF4337 domain-containing protein [Longimicrobiaceae bacterium]|nr:DUF4337 domain-containing protein [Longimicrobiaceae bacterium]